MCLIKVFVCLSVASIAYAVKYSKAMEGYPVGFMSDCPGSEKKAFITKKSLKHLSFTVQGPGSIFGARRREYAYHHAYRLMRDPDIDLRRRTVIYVGGYMDSPNFPFSLSLLKAYRESGYNTISLGTNWFTTLDYPIACRYMRPVGLHAAQVLANLTTLGLNPKKLELVGLSLGAHTIGYIAKNYRLITGYNISRLTGMDPAGPCFRNLPPDDRLDQSDADFVDVIATNIDGFGMATPIGHVNFYANGGEFQPGDFHFTACFSLCSHVRSYLIWLSAVQFPNKFLGVKCDSVEQARNSECFDRVPFETNVLGLSTDKTKTGIYFLATDNMYPYYLGEKGLKKKYEFWHSHLKAFNNNDIIKL